ncbi:RNA 2',3'-cyclic phosphodiesterase [Cytobacillus sp. Hz8]|uniref:RNA 2',3'-cyclic phosphodiesterase n=1 Tax=Cytobacillus sp. Hz8 TaxID=3347168 RepID=UPI0035E12B3D
MENRQHYFFAIRLPLEIKQKLSLMCQRIIEPFPFKRWVHEQDYHITLAFLGGAPQETLDRAKENVASKLHSHTSFPLAINHLGVFGKKDAPRIFLAGLDKEQRLDDLRADVYKACTEAGFSLETRPFNPHITLARKWGGETPFEPERLIQLQQDRLSRVECEIKEVVLYQTNLNQTPKYEAISLYKLKEPSIF